MTPCNHKQLHLQIEMYLQSGHHFPEAPQEACTWGNQAKHHALGTIQRSNPSIT
jgi:hypothetical protein